RPAGRGSRAGAGDRAFPLCAGGPSPSARGMLRGLQHPGSRVGAAPHRIRHAVLGVSGGLDSTQALIVSARAMDLLGRPRSDVLAYTLPGFATSDATRANAKALI